MIMGFSAWHHKEKRWLNDFDVAINGEGVIFLYSGGIEEDGYINQTDDVEIVRYTDKQDKNGKRIREGDLMLVVLPIVTYESSYYIESEEDKAKRIYGEVRIRLCGGPGLLIRKIIPEGQPGLKIGGFLKIHAGKDEIIGNKFENPKLLSEMKT